MITYQDLIEDGDRVHKVWLHDIEASDEPEIKRQIKEQLEETDEVPERMTVMLYSSVFEELIDIEVNTKDYI